MKTIKLLSIIFAACCVLWSCGGGDDDSSIPEPTPQPTPHPQPSGGKFLTMSYNMPATASQETIALTGLSSSITTMTGQQQSPWLTVSKEPYTSGVPKVTLTTVDNPDNKARTAYVVFVAARDTLALTVKQAASSGTPSGGTDVDNLHDSTTDQPAYSRGGSKE